MCHCFHMFALIGFGCVALVVIAFLWIFHDGF